jgi:DNA-directed RNA polymerase subunit RPC12/RpoP
VADPAAQDSYDVVCPHCGKAFEAELMTAASPSGSRGFKCPHCRLFVPYERANGSQGDALTD